MTSVYNRPTDRILEDILRNSAVWFDPVPPLLEILVPYLGRAVLGVLGSPARGRGRSRWTRRLFGKFATRPCRTPWRPTRFPCARSRASKRLSGSRNFRTEGNSDFRYSMCSMCLGICTQECMRSL